MLQPDRAGDGPATEYWRTYYEWRLAYGLEDSCMDELLAAIRSTLEEGPLTVEQRDRLARLASMIETERRLALECAA